MPNVSVCRRLGMASAVGLWTLALVSPVGAQVPREEPRLALLIGNSAYYTRQLLAQVKDGALAAKLGDVGQPGFLTLSGKIQPDGKASIDARGIVGDPGNTVNRLSQGATYTYRVDAVFEDARGVGNRTGDARPCSLTFVK